MTAANTAEIIRSEPADGEGTCKRCDRTDLMKVYVVKGTYGGVDISGTYGSECVRRAMGSPARLKGAKLDAVALAANAETERQQYRLHRWSQYLTPMGVITYRGRQSNGGADLTDQEIMDMAARIVGEARAYLGR